MKPVSQRMGYLAGLGTALIWTGFIIISRLGGKSSLTGYDILALRLGTAALLLVLFGHGVPRVHWQDVRLWSLAMLSGVLYGLLVYTGFKLAPAAHGAILLPGVQPFLIAILLWLIYGERPVGWRFAAYGLIGAGVMLTAVPLMGGEHSAGQIAGDAMLLGGSAVWAVFSVLAKRWNYSPWLLTCFVAQSSALVYLPVYGLLLPKGIALASANTMLIQALYQGIGPTILAMMLFLKAVEALGPARVSALIALVPVFAGVCAVPLLHEPLTIWLAAGLVTVSCGALLASRQVLPKPVATGEELYAIR